MDYVAYYRVSTKRQGVSGLGLEAQRYAVQRFAEAHRARIVAEFTEVESGRKDGRPELVKALRECRARGVTLLIAKLDRLSRNAAFLYRLKEFAVDFVCVDMPTANNLQLGIMIAMAEDEAERISERTRAALAERKRAGKKLGGRREGSHRLSRDDRERSGKVRAQRSLEHSRRLRGIIYQLMMDGCESAYSIAKGLTERGILTAKGNRIWHTQQVSRVLQQLNIDPRAPLEDQPPMEDDGLDDLL